MSVLQLSKESCRKVGNLHKTIKLVEQPFDSKFPNTDSIHYITLPQVCVMKINAEPQHCRQTSQVGTVSKPSEVRSRQTLDPV